MTSSPITVTLAVDPASEASWRASRWLASVEQARPIALSVTLAPTEVGRRAARVAAAASDLVGEDAIRAVYEAYGRRRFARGETHDATAIADALADIGLPTFLAFAADDPKWDSKLAEPSVRPLIIDSSEHELPTLDEVPTGAAATELFDALTRASTQG